LFFQHSDFRTEGENQPNLTSADKTQEAG